MDPPAARPAPHFDPPPMSVAAADSPAAPLPVAGGRSLPQSERVDFDYRPVPVSAPVAAVLGVLGLTAFLTAFGLLLAAAGVVVALLAWRAVRETEGGGLTLAIAGLALSLVGLVGGGATHAFAYATEVPDGHARVNFREDIARKAVTPQGGISPAVAGLDGERIFLKGYMYPDPSGKDADLNRFIFVESSGECCFGGAPKKTDMILVRMDGTTADFFPGLVSVAGTFALRPTGGRGELDPIFEMTATHAGPSRTSF